MGFRYRPNLGQDCLFVNHSYSTNGRKGTYRFLVRQHLMHFNVFDLWQHLALHDRSSFIILDIPNPSFTIKRDFFREPLFPKVPDGVIIGISEEIIDGRMSGSDMIFESVHQV